MAKKQKTPSKGSAHQQAIDIIAHGYNHKDVCTELAKKHPDLFVTLAKPHMFKAPLNLVTPVAVPDQKQFPHPQVATGGYTHVDWAIYVARHLKEQEFIKAIKTVREATGLGLKEAKDVCDRLRDSIGVSIPKVTDLTPQQLQAFKAVRQTQ